MFSHTRFPPPTPPPLPSHTHWRSEVQRLLSGVPCGSLVNKVDAMLMDLGVSSMQARAVPRGSGGLGLALLGCEGSQHVPDCAGASRGRAATIAGTAQPPSTETPGLLAAPQLDTASRGFSFAADGPLDMRLNPDAPLSAADVVHSWSEAQIGRALLEYGEEKLWRVVARRCEEAAGGKQIGFTQPHHMKGAARLGRLWGTAQPRTLWPAPQDCRGARGGAHHNNAAAGEGSRPDGTARQTRRRKQRWQADTPCHSNVPGAAHRGE